MDLKSMLPEEIKALLSEMGEPSFRAQQIFKWLSSGIESLDEMSNIPKKLREKLSETQVFHVPEIIARQESKTDGTIKYLWKFYDGNAVESVLMCYEHWNTLCISTQAGCRMGCAFCASTLNGRARDLLPSEMLDQVVFAQKDSGKRISNIVLMGTGEPLDNFDNVMRFLTLVNHPDGLNISHRKISLSTCGLVDKIDKLASYNLQLTLSISLHAPDNETRSKIMPVNRRYDVDELLSAARRYYQKTSKRVSFEYSMIDGVNDTDYHAELLCKKLKGSGAHINLITLNNVDESPLKPSKSARVKAFSETLSKNGLNVTLRRKLGSDIDAACGQLRKKMLS